LVFKRFSTSSALLSFPLREQSKIVDQNYSTRVRLGKPKSSSEQWGVPGPCLSLEEIDCKRGLLILNQADIASIDEWQSVISLIKGKKNLWSVDRNFAMTYQNVDQHYEAADFRGFQKSY
jgi:hypothetical protein